MLLIIHQGLVPLSCFSNKEQSGRCTVAQSVEHPKGPSLVQLYWREFESRERPSNILLLLRRGIGVRKNPSSAICCRYKSAAVWEVEKKVVINEPTAKKGKKVFVWGGSKWMDSILSRWWLFLFRLKPIFFRNELQRSKEGEKWPRGGRGGDFPDWPRHPSRPIVSAPDRPSIKMRLDKFSGGGRFLISW